MFWDREMNPIIRFPRSLPKPLPERAVTRFYRLLDTGVVGHRDKTYGGQEAALSVAREFNVPPTMVWRWVREHAEQNVMQTAQSA